MSLDATDPFETPEFRGFAKSVIKDLIPMLQDSAITVSLLPRDGDAGDVKYWVELGASIMLDKPIIVVASPGDPVPARLRKAADVVLEVDLHDETSRDRLNEQIAVELTKLEVRRAEGGV